MNEISDQPASRKLRVFVRDQDEWQPVLDMLQEISHCEVAIEPLTTGTVFWADDKECDAKMVLAFAGIEKEMTIEPVPDDRIPKVRTLFVSRSNDDLSRLWAFQHGADDVMIFPFTHPDLEMRLQRLVFSNRRFFLRQVPREEALDFLRSLIQDGVSEIRPALDPFAAIGHFYPAVANHFGRAIGGHELLERLADEDLLKGTISNRIRLCPVCNDLHLNYRENCPRCNSLNFQREDTLHHFPCGHVDSIQTFRGSGKDLVCPKCSKELRHIGLDYERLSQNHKCQDCAYVFAEAAVDVQCLWCGWTGEAGNTLERRIFSYEISTTARDLLQRATALVSQETAVLGKGSPGLFSREYFGFELQRELQRHQLIPRYEFCLMMIRVADFDHIRNEHEAESKDYLIDLFKALREPLSELAVACVAEYDTLAVILPGFTSEKAMNLAKEIDRSVHSMTHLLPIHEPNIVGAVVPSSENFSNANDMMNKARQELGR